jgi:hypothetical protein
VRSSVGCILSSLFLTFSCRYCDSRMSPHRLAAQTMLWRALRTLVQSFAPILPHLAEDVFRQAPALFTHDAAFAHSEQSAKEYGSSVFHYGLQHPALYGENVGRTFSSELAADISESHNMVAGAFMFARALAVADACSFPATLPIRLRANAAIERARSAGLVGSPSDIVLTVKVLVARVTCCSSNIRFAFLMRFKRRSPSKRTVPSCSTSCVLCLSFECVRCVIVPQVQLVATGEMSIICGCSGVSVLTSTGNSLVSHPNSPSLFQGEVLDQESFDLTPSVAVCSSHPFRCCPVPRGFIVLKRLSLLIHGLR